MKRRLLFLLASASSLLAACSQDEAWEPQAPPPGDSGAVFRLKAASYDNLPATRASEKEPTGYDRLEYYIMDSNGTPAADMQMQWRPETSEIIAEGLHEGDYTLLILGIRGDADKDGAEIRTLTNASDTWIEFPEEMSRPLEAEYFYSRTPFHITSGQTELQREVSMRRIIGSVEFTFTYNNPLVRTAVASRELTLGEEVAFRTSFTADSLYKGSSTGRIHVPDLEEGAALNFLPLADEGELSGEIAIETASYTGERIGQSYDFRSVSLAPNRRDCVQTLVTHPDDKLGTLFVTRAAWAGNSPSLILQDNEKKDVYTNNSKRTFHTTRPLQTEITEDGRLHVTFYSPRPLCGVTLRATLPSLGEEVDIAYFDSIPAFGEVTIPFPRVGKPAVFRTAEGRYREIANLQASELRQLSDKLEIYSEDEYWKLLSKIEVDYRISFGLYGGNPDKADGGPVGNWMGIRPVHCREAVALWLNITYMLSSEEVAQLMRDNPESLYGNDGSTRIPPETVISQYRASRHLIAGLVYSKHGTIGLGGGTVWGVYQEAYLQHYTNAYRCQTIFHELGHCMGYGHSSAFTYGPWAQQLMNKYYVNHIGQFPVNSASWLNSSSNPNIY